MIKSTELVNISLEAFLGAIKFTMTILAGVVILLVVLFFLTKKK